MRKTNFKCGINTLTTSTCLDLMPARAAFLQVAAAAAPVQAVVPARKDLQVQTRAVAPPPP